ncbi:Hypothetical predicted protein [Paramuricea clavata]|uniref:Uncharacterized protein n=1 Tax=Paramuricea clavata TaxID=317549 RepID=A0A7D9DE58_PARCT|nr:Hypothetical predicted protein [Paramuricea clavata]
MSNCFELQKNKLIWNGDLSELKSYVAEKLNINGKWKSPSGGRWLFTSDALSITWYCKSKTVLFQGPRGSEVADSLKKNIDASRIAIVKDAELNIATPAASERRNETIDNQCSLSINNSNSNMFDRSSNTTTTINRSDSDASEGKANEQEMCSHKQNEGDYIMNCKDCSKLSVEVAEIKLDLALLFLKVNTAEAPATCECNRLRNENQLLKQEIKLLKETLHGMELSKSPINIAIDNMNNQPTITDNDSVVLIDIEESEVNVNTNMNNLPSATDKEKQYNTRGPVVNDSLMKYRNPNKPVVQDSLTSFDHLLKEKAVLNANMHRHKRNQVHNSPTNRTHFSKPNYRRNQAALNANMDRHKRNPMHNSSTNRTHFSKPNYRRNQFSEPKHQYRQANFPSQVFRSGRYRRIPKPRTTANNTDTRASQINPAYKVNPFQSKSELQLGETESWEAYLELVNRTLDQFGTLV